MRRAGRLILVVLLTALSLLQQPLASPNLSALATQSRSVALGISSLPYGNLSNVDAHTTAYGRAPAIWSVWSDWGRTNGTFPTGLLNSLRDRGIVPMVFWEPILPPA